MSAGPVWGAEVGAGATVGGVTGFVDIGVIGDFVGAGVGTVTGFVDTGLRGAWVGAAVGVVAGFDDTRLIGFSVNPRFTGKLQCCHPSADLRHCALPQHWPCTVGLQVTHMAEQPTCLLGKMKNPLH